MRRVTITVIAVGAALLACTSPAMADTSASAAAAAPVAGKKVCAVTDSKLGEISGIVATGTGYVMVNSGGVENQPENHQKIFAVSSACKVVKTGSYGGSGPRSPQDIVRAKDGTLWIADTGEGKERPTVALWKVAANLAGSAVPYRFTYPEGDKHDAKALLINGNGIPIIVTLESNGTALLYAPASAPMAGKTLPLQQVGKITILRTATENVLGGAGRVGFNGAAVSADGTKVVLRTHADAYEWDVSDGDVLAAVKTEPRVTGLPMEPWSEAITYSADGAKLITASRLDKAKGAGQNIASPVLLSYTPTTKKYEAPATSSAAGGGDSWFTKWWKGLSLNQAYALLAGIGFAGLLLVIIGVYGMVNGRKKRSKGSAAKKARRRDEAEGYDDLAHLDNSATAFLAPVHGQEYDDRGYGAPQPGYPPQPYPHQDGGYAEPGRNTPPQYPPQGEQGWGGNSGRGY
jgi:hypothetical protein